MKTHAQAVIIGGGLAGCSILYHLAKLGWTDIVLLERDELTSGSTWHAAANIHGLHDHNNTTRIQHYTMTLYKQLEEETGQGCGVFQPGSLYLAQSEEREHQLRLQEAKARLFGLGFHEISHERALELHPLAQFDDVRCIMFEPDGGNVDPSGVTMAYAAGARQRGAQIERFCPVTGTEQQPDGSWIVRTEKGDIHTDWVVNAAGLWGREVAAMADIELPLQPTEHQYFVTEAMPEIETIGRRLPSIADRDGEYYFRQEGNGLLIGAYEEDMRFWAEDGTPADFGHELFEDDLDRIMENVMRAIDRVPLAANAGVKRVINGPMIWSPDSSVLFGPVPELKNYFCCTGIIPGFSQSGGFGLLAAQWMIEGEPQYDMFAWDLARFDDWADKAFTRARVRDQYIHRFKIHFPNEERDAGRPGRTRPAYEMQRERGAVFGLNAGWEHPLWFADTPGTVETAGFTRQNWFAPVGYEARMLRDNVGVIDISNFANYVISGPSAHSWLDALVANHVPRDTGKSCLTPLIAVRGGLAGDFTITCTGDDSYMMIGSGMAERYHRRFFDMVAMPDDTKLEFATTRIAGFNVAGPRSREMLQRMTNADLSNDAWGFMQSRWIDVAGIRCLAIRVSFTGDLGWELHCDAGDQCASIRHCWQRPVPVMAARWEAVRWARCGSKRDTGHGDANIRPNIGRRKPVWTGWSVSTRPFCTRMPIWRSRITSRAKFCLCSELMATRQRPAMPMRRAVSRSLPRMASRLAGLRRVPMAIMWACHLPSAMSIRRLPVPAMRLTSSSLANRTAGEFCRPRLLIRRAQGCAARTAASA